MNEIFQTPGKGLQLDPETLELRMNWAKDPNVSLEDDGMYIDETGVAQNIKGKIDTHTITLTGLDKDRNGILGVNHSVVVCCYSMCQYVVIDRSSKGSFAVDKEQLKTIQDIRDEMNAVSDGYAALGKSIPMGMPITQYKIQPGDLLTLRKSYVAAQVEQGDEIWPVAAEDLNRYETDEITVLFYVETASWSADLRLDQLTLLCLWSTLDNFVAGCRYGFPTIQKDPDPVTES